MSRSSQIASSARLAMLLAAAACAASCGAARPDLRPFAAATAKLYTGVVAVGQDSARELAHVSTQVACPVAAVPSTSPIPDPPQPAPAAAAAPTAAAPARASVDQLTVAACFERVWAPRVAAAAALVTYSDRLAEVATIDDDAAGAQAARGALDALLGELSLPIFGAVSEVAGGALLRWRQQQASERMAEVVAQAAPIIESVVGVLLADLADTRALIGLLSSQLRLELVVAHIDELSLRAALERQRHAYIELLDQPSAAAPDSDSDAAERADDRPVSTHVLAELVYIEDLLARLPDEEALTPPSIAVALAAIDACADALAAWHTTHQQLARALTEHRAPPLHTLRAATDALFRLVAARGG
ncbi:MAG: hypothetical protein Tsb0020_19620 [Haliangiales bacterium]